MIVNHSFFDKIKTKLTRETFQISFFLFRGKFSKRDYHSERYILRQKCKQICKQTKITTKQLETYFDFMKALRGRKLCKRLKHQMYGKIKRTKQPLSTVTCFKWRNKLVKFICDIRNGKHGHISMITAEKDKNIISLHESLNNKVKTILNVSSGPVDPDDLFADLESDLKERTKINKEIAKKSKIAKEFYEKKEVKRKKIKNKKSKNESNKKNKNSIKESHNETKKSKKHKDHENKDFTTSKKNKEENTKDDKKDKDSENKSIAKSNKKKREKRKEKEKNKAVYDLDKNSENLLSTKSSSNETILNKKISSKQKPRKKSTVEISREDKDSTKSIKAKNNKKSNVKRFNKESNILANDTNKSKLQNIKASKILLSRNNNRTTSSINLNYNYLGPYKRLYLNKSEPIIKPLYVSKSFVPVYQSFKPLYLRRQSIPEQTLSLISVDNFSNNSKHLFSKSLSFCSLNNNKSFTSSLKTCSYPSVKSSFSGLDNDIYTSKDSFSIKNTKSVLSKSSNLFKKRLVTDLSNRKEDNTKNNCSSNTSLIFQSSLYNNTSKSSICVSTSSKANSTALMSKTTINNKIYKPTLLSKISSKHSCLKSKFYKNSFFEPRETEQNLDKDKTFFSNLLSCNFTVNNFLRKNENIFKSFYPTYRLHDEVMMKKSNELPSFLNWITNEEKQKKNLNKQKETIKICEYFYLKDETSIEYYKKFPKERQRRNDFSKFVSTIDLKIKK